MAISCEAIGRNRRQSATGELDASDFARRLRHIALEMHAAVTHRRAPLSELVDLERRIDELRQYSRGSQMGQLDRWLQNARAQIHQRVSASGPSPHVQP